MASKAQASSFRRIPEDYDGYNVDDNKTVRPFAHSMHFAVLLSIHPVL